MAGMSIARSWLVAAIAALGVLAAACGGGGGDDADTPGQRITDPALVPSSTPVAPGISCENEAESRGVCYKITGEQVEIRGTVATVQAGGTTVATGSSTYTVEAGDLCVTIADAFGITSEELMAANRTIDANCGNLHEGDVLIIPGQAPATTTTAPNATPTPPGSGSSGGTYTVGSGESCESIAAETGTTAQAIIAANPEINATCTNLQPDQVITIP